MAAVGSRLIESQDVGFVSVAAAGAMGMETTLLEERNASYDADMRFVP